MSEVKEKTNDVSYSLDFLNKLNSILPEGDLKQKALLLANNNELKLGSILDELTDEKIDNIEIVKAFEKGDLALHNLFVKAKRLANYEDLWNSWMSEIENGPTRT
jgi:hypothetical protein